MYKNPQDREGKEEWVWLFLSNHHGVDILYFSVKNLGSYYGILWNVVGTIIILNYIHPEDPFVKSDFNKCTQTQKNKNYM